MRDLDELSREEAIHYLKFLSGLAIAVDGLWFMAVEKTAGFDEALRMDIDVWAGYAPVVVKRIRREFGIRGKGLEALKEVISHDPLWWSMDFRIVEDSTRRLAFEVWDCPSLIAQEKIGRDTLTCEPVERAYLDALVQAVDPGIKVEALKLPPRKSSDGVCCRWAFCVEG
ncbi:MAG: hypothetical protein AMK69_22305 [Nitrospira bacterium SG8_3]|nr:MAG: hypothetical protein AMK69_22305 [Nitrospira bacterium SG8_3]